MSGGRPGNPHSPAPDDMGLILASSSPRRRDLLTLLQVPFASTATTFLEHLVQTLPPAEQARSLAQGKARSCRARFTDSVILSGDTLITLNGAILGKPTDLAEARSMLTTLRGREHTIHTAVALLGEDDRFESDVETVTVRMHAYGEAELEEYLRSMEWEGKAGSYAIQGIGGELVESIMGDYTAVVGLPLRLTASLLGARGIGIGVDIERLYREKPYPNWSRFGKP